MDGPKQGRLLLHGVAAGAAEMVELAALGIEGVITLLLWCLFQMPPSDVDTPIHGRWCKEYERRHTKSTRFRYGLLTTEASDGDHGEYGERICQGPEHAIGTHQHSQHE